MDDPISYGTSWENSHMWNLSPWDSHRFLAHGTHGPMGTLFPHGDHVWTMGITCEKKTFPWVFSHGGPSPLWDHRSIIQPLLMLLNFGTLSTYPDPRPNWWLRAVQGGFLRLRHQSPGQRPNGLTDFGDPKVVFAQVGDGEYEYTIIHGPPLADKPLWHC